MADNTSRLGYLDGLRGLAALWVFVGHATHFNQLNIHILSRPAFAVDLFMLLSGFLMFYQAQLRVEKESFDTITSWITFWLRRFFRIAPVYYVALMAGFFVGSYLANDWRTLISAQGWDSNSDQFMDHSFQNIVMHLSFLFGLFPAYLVKTPLPDWSIALEMQFYAVFPFLFLCMMKFGPVKTALFFAVACVCFNIAFADFLHSFKQPGLLPLRLHVFLAGMLIAAAFFKESKMTILGLVAAALLLGMVGRSKDLTVYAIDFLMIASLAGLSLHHKIGRPLRLSGFIDKTGTLLGNRLFHFLGETSYSVYLIHILVLLPVANYLYQYHNDLSSPVRFFLTLLFSIPVVYGLGYLLLLTVERPGIEFGRRMVKHMGKTASPNLTTTEIP